MFQRVFFSSSIVKTWRSFSSVLQLFNYSQTFAKNFEGILLVITGHYITQQKYSNLGILFKLQAICSNVTDRNEIRITQTIEKNHSSTMAGCKNQSRFISTTFDWLIITFATIAVQQLITAPNSAPLTQLWHTIFFFFGKRFFYRLEEVTDFY